MQLLQADLANGVWIVRSLFPPGVTIQTHKHTGHVYAFTQSGQWHYLESPEALNTAGSYLFEPAGSVHTLHVPADNEGDTDVWFRDPRCQPEPRRPGQRRGRDRRGERPGRLPEAVRGPARPE